MPYVRAPFKRGGRMMKVKIIDDPKLFAVTLEKKEKAPELETVINDFIKDKKVIDIKYQSNVSYTASNGVSDAEYDRSVLIMYEEEE